MVEYTTLEVVWFVLLSILWVGYFALEGYDYGAMMLLRVVGREQYERRMLLHSVGPWWDANQVWLIVAAAGTLAAFPEWYATLFSGFYLLPLLILVGLILRGVAFEFWGKDDSPRWRSTWEWAAVVGSLLPAFLWGVVWANIVHGTPIDGRSEPTGSLADLLGGYALLGGLTTLTLFLLHGAIFITLRVEGPMVARARRVAKLVGPVAAVATIAFLVWTIVWQGDHGGVEVLSLVCAVGAGVLVVAGVPLAGRWAVPAIAATTGCIALLSSALFIDLFPHVMISSTDPANSMTLHEAASGDYTLKVMTIVAGLLLPFVLGYQIWSHWVFRRRLRPADYAPSR
jgi:cytochrome bd ubiquinol oxidase subunit II